MVIAPGVVKKCLVVFITAAVDSGCGKNVNIPRLFVGLVVVVEYILASVVGSVVEEVEEVSVSVSVSSVEIGIKDVI